VGRKRAAAIARHPKSELVLVHDLDREAAAALAGQSGAAMAASWQEVVESARVDIAVVSTSHDALALISEAALRAGKHVLCEKPAGRDPAEVRRVVEAAEAAGQCLKAGYNHRYHPAIARVRQAFDAGRIGPILFIRGRYGHGGRPGYEREWRADPARAGGGEMLDQGAHLVDLCLWFLGDFAQVTGAVSTCFWEIAPLEDNAFGLFSTPGGQVASLHVSWTQWKNLFEFEVFGREGYAIARGLGGSYGPEHALIGQRQPGGPPVEERFDFPGEDRSWDLEWEDFLRAVDTGVPPQASGREALRTMEWVYRLYQAARSGRAMEGGEYST